MNCTAFYDLISHGFLKVSANGSSLTVQDDLLNLKIMMIRLQITGNNVSGDQIKYKTHPR